MSLLSPRTLAEYHYWARDRVLQAVASLTPEQYTADLNNSFRSIRDTLVHVYSAEWVWLARWKGISPSAHLSPDQFPDQATLTAAWNEHGRELLTFVEGVGDEGFGQVIEYISLDGTPGRQVLGPLLQHMVNHASYHRGQVTMMLRLLGTAPPPSTDLIHFLRERDAPALTR